MGGIGAGVALALLGSRNAPTVGVLRRGVRGRVDAPRGADAGLLRWAACWAGAVAVAALLDAVQLLPTWEASQWSARSGVVEATGALTIGPRTALALLGPSLSYAPPHTWETQGVFGVFWLSAAVAAPVLVGGRTRWRFGVLCGLVVFSLGGAALVEWLPGFRLFRIPTRMLLVVAFPLAFLAGVTTDAVTRAAWSLDARAAIARAGSVASRYSSASPRSLGCGSRTERRGGRSSRTGPRWSLVPFVRVLQNQNSPPEREQSSGSAVLLVDLLAPGRRFSPR